MCQTSRGYWVNGILSKLDDLQFNYFKNFRKEEEKNIREKMKYIS